MAQTNRFLALILLFTLFLTGPPISVQAASYTTVVSSKDGKAGIMDYGNFQVDYVIRSDLLKLVEDNTESEIHGHKNPLIADVVFEIWSGGQWVVDPNPVFSLDTTTCVYSDGEHVKAAFWYDMSHMAKNEVVTINNRRIRMHFSNAATDRDGNWHDVNVIVSNFDFFWRGTRNPGNTTFMLQKDGAGIGMRTSEYADQTTWNGDWAVEAGIYDVSLSVEGASSSESTYIAFYDIDQPGKNGYSGSFAERPGDESVKIMSGIYPGTQPHVPRDHCLRIINGSQPEFHSTRGTGADGEPSIYCSSMSYIATASGTTFRWSGTSCGTGLNPWIDGFEVLTKVRTEKAGSPVTGTKRYDDFWKVDSVWYHALQAPVSYSYTYSNKHLLNDWWLTDADDWIYDFHGQTVGESGLTSGKEYPITINRHRYTYAFKPNPPTGKAVSDVSGMPGDKTVVAAKETSGMSDATVKSPSLPGYVFKGWNTKTDGSGSAYPGAETMKSDKVFYAQWEPATYKVHFDPNGAFNPDHETGEFTQNTVKGNMADQVMQFDTSANLTANTFSRDGYTFAGWNTKADGTGMSYADQQSVRNLIAYDRTEITLYAQWVKKPGTETITVISEETGNPVKGVDMMLQKKVDGVWTNVMDGTTNENGQITADNLHWFDYRWVMESVPAGYVKSADTGFHINWDLLQAENQVILYLKHVQIILDAQVSDIIKGEEPPAFLYHIKGVDAAGVEHAYHLLVQTDVGSKFGTNRIPDLFAGTYTVTQMPVSRYVPGTVIPVSNSTADGVNASVDVLNNDQAEVKFPYTIREYGWFYGVNSIVNHLSK